MIIFTEVLNLMEGEWSSYIEVVTFMEGEWSRYRGVLFKGGRMIMLWRMSL